MRHAMVDVEVVDKVGTKGSFVNGKIVVLVHELLPNAQFHPSTFKTAVLVLKLYF